MPCNIYRTEANRYSLALERWHLISLINALYFVDYRRSTFYYGKPWAD